MRAHGIAVPPGRIARTPADCAAIAAQVGPDVVVKAQIPAGGRGKSGAVCFAGSPAEAHAAAAALLGTVLDGFEVGTVLVEERADIARELYAAIINDSETKGPLLVFSTEGGTDIEEANERAPEQVHRLPVDVRTGPRPADVMELLARTDLTATQQEDVSATLDKLYRLYREVDAELVEVNPLVLTRRGAVLALDAKVTLDPAARPRRAALVTDLLEQLPDTLTDLERQAERQGLSLIEFDGNVGVLANGAGLTMTTLDAVNHFGGRPANFLEIGGDAYTKAMPAVSLVLANPNVRSLVVNFCGAFARTDVMTAGVVAALEQLRPSIPVFFTIHGTGEEAAVALVRDRLGRQPYEHMDDAIRAAVAAAGSEVPVR